MTPRSPNSAAASGEDVPFVLGPRTARRHLVDAAGLHRGGVELRHEELATAARVWADVDLRETIERVLEVAVSALDMEVAALSELRGEHQFWRNGVGATGALGIPLGAATPLSGGACGAMLDGEIDPVVPDLLLTTAARRSAVVGSGIRAHISVPVRLTDGSLYGTLCAASRVPMARVIGHEAATMRSLSQVVASHLSRHEQTVRVRQAELELVAVRALLSALDARDGYTGEHSRAVVRLACEVGARLGMTPTEIADIEQGAMLHDLGKLGIPDAVLHKPGPLDEDEWALMRRHPAIGAQIVASVPSLSRLAPILAADHERWDGAGYPMGLSGDGIPLAARIVFACDAFDAMTTDRPYRRAMSPEAACLELQRNAGTQFDPGVVRVLLDVVRERSEATDAALETLPGQLSMWNGVRTRP